MASQQVPVQYASEGQLANVPIQRVDFQTGLCSCFEQPTHCVAGCCAFCWPCMLSQAGARSGGRYVLGANTFSESFSRWIMVIIAIYVLNAVGQTVVQLSIRGEVSTTVTTILNIVTFAVNLFMIYTMYMLRINVREFFGMQRSDCEDLCVSCCCTCCSVVQVAREVGVQEPCSMDCEMQDAQGGAYAAVTGHGSMHFTGDYQDSAAQKQQYYDDPPSGQPAAIPQGFPDASKQKLPPV